MSKQKEVKAPEAIEEKDVKVKKPNIFARFFNYLKDCFHERKKIVWYGKKQTAVATVLVTISIVVLAAVIGGLDYLINILIDLANRIY